MDPNRLHRAQPEKHPGPCADPDSSTTSGPAASGARGWGAAALLACLAAAAIAHASAAQPEASSRAQTVLAADFEQANALQGWAGPVKLEAGYRGGSSLSLQVKAGDADSSSVCSVPFPLENARGRLVRGSVMVRGENLGARPQPWNGAKCMLAIETPGRKLWPQAQIPDGTFDWQRVAFTVRVPGDATSARLVLGLERVSGKVWFDDLKFTAVAPPSRPEARIVSGPPYTGRDLPRLRGAMISPDIDAAGLRVLGHDWGANLIRWQLIRHGRPGQPSSLADYDTWLDGELKKLDGALAACRENGLLVVIDLHSPPGGKATDGGYVGADDRLFTDPACQEKFVSVWERIARRYRDSRSIWGYDLVNEPVEDFVEEGCDDWQALAERAARAVRAIDPVRTLIVEPASWGGPDGLADLEPLSVSNVVYSVHMYQPHAFTHQGVHRQGPPLRYPGEIDGKAWDKSELERALRPVVEFQRKHGVHIYIGEFSAIRWAPEGSAARYLSDLIDIFEANQWDWSYHAFREWSGWSVEHGSDPRDEKPSAQPTDRQLLLRNWFSRNAKPRG